MAVVNGTNITLGHMIVARESLPEQYKTLPNDVLFKGILDQLIQQTALEQSISDKITKSNFSPRANRLGMESGALPTDAPNALMTLFPDACSYMGTNCL